MSREWVDDRKRKPVDKRWVMRCDVGTFDSTRRKRCSTESEPQVDARDLPLERFRDEGWFIADKHGDVCPGCLAQGVVPRDNPHRIMAESAPSTDLSTDAQDST